jgi:hypothetical protein
MLGTLIVFPFRCIAKLDAWLGREMVSTAYVKAKSISSTAHDAVFTMETTYGSISARVRNEEWFFVAVGDWVSCRYRRGRLFEGLYLVDIEKR